MRWMKAATTAVLGLALLIVPASAANVQQVRFPITISVLQVDCPPIPSDITGVGEGHAVASISVDSQGRSHVTFPFDAHGTASAATGERYVFGDSDNFAGTFDDTDFEFTVTENFHLVGRGRAPNVSFHANLHVRVKDGNVSVVHENVRGNPGCIGV
jgi:hypothetical protein